MATLGFVGGTGVYNIDGVSIVNEHLIETPFGIPSDKIIEAQFNDNKFFFLPRHGKNHTFLPGEINYRANIFAMKKLGVEFLVSISAVGSLKEKYPPNCFVLPDQFIDWTKGTRQRTFFGGGIVGHVSAANPVDDNLQELIFGCCKEQKISAFKGGSYICIEGPQFSSKAESNIFRSFGASIIGMTNVPEAYLAKEAGLGYSTIGMVTDYDCWKEEHCSLEEILKVMKKNNEMAKRLVKEIVQKFYVSKLIRNQENINSILTSRENISLEQKHFVEVLLK